MLWLIPHQPTQVLLSATRVNIDINSTVWKVQSFIATESAGQTCELSVQVVAVLSLKHIHVRFGLASKT